MTNISHWRNPYIVGKTINEPEKFFGREDLFAFLEDNLNNNIQIQLLHGQRRIGKSSLLKQFPHKIKPENQKNFVFICFDLQMYSKSSVSHIIYKLAQTICEELDRYEYLSIFPNDKKNNNILDIFCDTFLPTVCNQELGNKKLVLLLDESDVAIINNDNINNNFFPYLKTVLIKQKQLFVIPVLGRFDDDLENLFQLFDSPPTQKIDLLYEISARRLITNPAKGMLEYQEDAINTIFELSSCHPYLIQGICFNLFLQAKSAIKSKVNHEDVNKIVDETIDNLGGGLEGLWNGLSINEKVFFATVAEVQKIAIEQVKSSEDPFTLLKSYGVIQTEEIIQATKQLVKKGYLEGTERERRVKIELVRRWLIKYHPLNQEINELEKINKEEIDKIAKQELELYRDNSTQDIINHYEKILTLNPNHFKTIPRLAKKYLDIENFEKALELYTRAYHYNRIENKENLLQALEAYGKNLRKQGKLTKAKIQFDRALEIEPEKESVKEQLAEINTELEKQEVLQIQQLEEQLTKPDINNSKNPLHQRVILGMIVGLIALLGGSIAVNLSSSIPNPLPTTTPTTTPKADDNIQSNISSGDHILLLTNNNTRPDEALKAFKEGNYSKAVELFEKAITNNPNNRNNPELRIYYNNAKARDKAKTGDEYSPLTLAVVVPGNDQSKAQEILRGVAQSQEQFNVNGGQNGRLLQILIANDTDDEEKAKKIAKNLVQKDSLLGVIGHGSSQTTQAALNIYKQADIAIISPTSTASTLQGKNFFRTTPSNAAFGETLDRYATNYPFKKVVIFYNPTSNYSNSIREEFIKNFAGQVVRLIDLTDPQLDIEKELRDTASQQVQAVILFPDIKYTATALEVAKVNLDKNLGLMLLGGDSLYNKKTLDNGKNVEGLVLAVPWFREAPQAKDFSQEAKQQWVGEISWRTATSYDATQAFVKSLSSRPSRATILQRLQNLNLSPKGISEDKLVTSGDDLKFKNGERQSKAILVTIEQGQFKCLQQCSP
ncbi:ABC transporter substrate-binding protein [Nostoc sp. PA-18-2419]|uniref:ABC transporter substrate-binding protein n=1 Tax=Nostoc sp. PA-18-2419 TaxID=2575443 RepID=UPI00110886D0|nr:ABC transporter substrate-binding protein [Nostoc sp. PA-18-2419]